ncbi:hypothetical protein D3C79_1115940 [compost metagenome]
MNTGTGQLARVVIGRDVQFVLLRHHFDATFAVLNIHRPFDVCTAVVFQPQINANCHFLLLHYWG